MSTLIRDLCADRTSAALDALKLHIASTTPSALIASLPAHIAATHNNAAALALLPPAALCVANDDGLLPAHIAAQLGHVDILLHLRDNAPTTLSACAENLAHDSPLRLAVKNGSFDAVKFLIEQCNISVNERSDNTASPLLCGVLHGDVAMVRYLCERGADVHWRGREADALLLAVKTGRLPLARLLLDAGADVNVRFGDSNGVVDDNDLCTALTLAVRNKDADMARLLIERGANVNVFATAAKDDVYGTHLVQACLAGAVDCAQLIARAGADPNCFNSHGFTPLMSLARLGNFEAVKCIVAVGADCGVVHARHGSALMQSAMLGHSLILAFLAKLGQSIHQVDASTGMSPLMVAAEGGHATTVRCLIDLGARLDAANRGGYTALMLAAHRGHADVVHVLLAGGANAAVAIKLNVFKKITALSLAKSGNHRAVVQLLTTAQQSPDRKSRQQQILTKKDE